MKTMISEDPIRTMHHPQGIKAPVQTSDIHTLLKTCRHRNLILAVMLNRRILLPDRRPNLALDGRKQDPVVLFSVMLQLMIQP
jgi:hypothetical protein